MMQHSIAVADRIEDVVVLGAPRWYRRYDRRVLQIRTVDVVKLHQILNMQWAIEDVNVVSVEIVRSNEILDHVCRHIRRHFETHRCTEPSLAQFLRNQAE